MVSMKNVVIVEDHRDMRESLVDLIADAGLHVVAFESAEALWSGSNLRTVDIVVLDLNLPGVDGSRWQDASALSIRKLAL